MAKLPNINMKSKLEQKFLPNLIFKCSRDEQERIVLTLCDGVLLDQFNILQVDLCNKTIDELIPAKYKKKIMAAILQSFNGERSEVSLRYKKRDFSIAFSPVPSNTNAEYLQEVIGFVVEKQNASYYDPLTGIPNLMLLMKHINTHLNNPSAILCLDLDRFRIVNDMLGYTFGDQFLIEAVQKITYYLNQDDIIARVGSDEFIIFIQDIKDLGHIEKMATNIVKAFSAPTFLNSCEFFITVSLGIAIYPENGCDGEGLLKNAFAAMHRAKELGGNNYEFYTPAMNSKNLERLAMENDLRHALEREEFIIHYQPQIDTVTRKVVGVEALVRWNHPEHGVIQPNDFIPLAEETGLIIEIGEWVLRKACFQIKAWLNEGFSSLRLAVNLSARQFKDNNLVNTVKQILTETRLRPQLLELEITESAVMQDAEYTTKVLNEFQEMGVSISLDDFGTGYSSLNYLKNFPINTLKIDRTFIREIAEESKDAAIVKALIVLAKSLRLNVISEGVETLEQASFLNRHNCYIMQGFLYSKPITATELKAVIEKN